ncbi:sporulation protein Cse60 [Erysipelotrichaceae bacterium HCN-30851]
MIQVKVFDEEHEDDLTEAINGFLKEKEIKQLIDIKFSTSISHVQDEQLYCFSAMLIYLL